MSKSGHSRFRSWLLEPSALVVALALAPTAHAQTAPASENAASQDVVVVTGSRFGPRVVTDSPTPIDSIPLEELARGGGTDLQSQLKVVIPSFSTSRPTAAGSSDFITPPTMRGLSPGQILVLLNGKRRHNNGDLNTGNQIGRGDVAYDFNAIPTAAISRVEVLRDGAAAQYGSDAIAGVMNLQLDDSLGFLAQARYGQTSHKDGEHAELTLANGFAIGEGGFIRITGQYQDHTHTDRALPDTRQQYFGANGANLVLPSANFGSGIAVTPSAGTLDPREATVDRDIWVFGEPEYTNASVFVNAGLPLSDTVRTYAFGGWNQLEGISYNFFRRAGQDETIRSIYPDGFLPLQDIDLENFSAAGGVKGEDLLGFGWDLSTLYGGAKGRIGYSNSNNVSLGPTSPTVFDRGGWEFRQWTTNFDVTREIPVGDASPLKLALGLEYRKEFYELEAGEPNSYANGGATIVGGPNTGRPGPAGAQPGGGITPEDAADADRDSKAAYVEVEKAFFDRLLLSGAVRYEEFSDFGDTTNYKVAGRFEIFDGLAVRGSWGTGFRAPNLAQSYFSQSNISFVNGQPLRIRVVSVNNPLAPVIGASPLKPEESENASAGIVVDIGNFSATLDAYNIEITDRIAISSNFQSTALTNLLAAQGYPGISAVAYLTNAVDTTTSGVDFTARYRQDLGAFGDLTTTFAANFNETEFDRIAGTPAALSAIGITTSLFDLTQQVRYTDSTPKDKFTLNLAWELGNWSASTTVTRYGEVAQVALTGRTPAQVAALTTGYDVSLLPAAPGSANSDIIQTFSDDYVADIEASYRFTDNFKLTGGVSNVFDEYPDRQIASTAASVATGTNGADNNGIFPYAYIAPYGTSGRFYYVKAAYSF